MRHLTYHPKMPQEGCNKWAFPISVSHPPCRAGNGKGKTSAPKHAIAEKLSKKLQLDSVRALKKTTKNPMSRSLRPAISRKLIMDCLYSSLVFERPLAFET